MLIVNIVAIFECGEPVAADNQAGDEGAAGYGINATGGDQSADK